MKPALTADPVTLCVPTSHGAGQSTKADRQACVQILRDYQGLCKVLHGALPGVALGTPVTPAVLAKRVALLAESCCLSPSPEHDQATISDCEVVLYMAGAFLQAPFWRFEVRRPASSHGGGKRGGGHPRWEVVGRGCFCLQSWLRQRAVLLDRNDDSYTIVQDDSVLCYAKLA